MWTKILNLHFFIIAKKKKKNTTYISTSRGEVRGNEVENSGCGLELDLGLFLTLFPYQLCDWGHLYFISLNYSFFMHKAGR